MKRVVPSTQCSFTQPELTSSDGAPNKYCGVSKFKHITPASKNQPWALLQRAKITNGECSQNLNNLGWIAHAIYLNNCNVILSRRRLMIVAALLHQNATENHESACVAVAESGANSRSGLSCTFLHKFLIKCWWISEALFSCCSLTSRITSTLLFNTVIYKDKLRRKWKFYSTAKCKLRLNNFQRIEMWRVNWY